MAWPLGGVLGLQNSDLMPRASMYSKTYFVLSELLYDLESRTRGGTFDGFGLQSRLVKIKQIHQIGTFGLRLFAILVYYRPRTNDFQF